MQGSSATSQRSARSSRRCERRLARALAAALLALAGDARAGGPLTPSGTPLRTSDYGVDLFQGPVLATTRITALGGAYTAIAEGTEGIQFNPAAASWRGPYGTTRDDYDFTGGITLPASVTSTDFDNDGKVGTKYDDFFWATFGGSFQHDHLGFGMIASFQNYALPTDAVPLPGSNEVVSELVIRILRLDPVISYGFFDEQLHVGGGLRYAAIYGIGATETAAGVTNERILLNANTIGVQSGLLWTPRPLPLRVGAAARSPTAQIEGDPGRIPKNAEGDRVVGATYLPNRIELPWELEAGVALQLWKRPLNLPRYEEERVPRADTERWRRTKDGQQEPPWKGARRMLRARHAEIPRQKVLLSFGALVTGPVQRAVSVESMLAQTVQRSGETPSLTVRGGVEVEPIPSWLVLRGGSYVEPSRFRTGETRLHGTTGFALRVLRSSIWGLFEEDTLFRISGAVDVARDYFGWSVGAGVFR